MSIIANSPEAIALLKRVGIPELIHQSDSLLKGDVGFDFETVLPLLHTAANEYRGQGQHAEAKSVFERILRHVPSDYNVRAVLADYALQSHDHDTFANLLTPAIPMLLENPVLHGRILGHYCRHAFVRHDFGSALAIYKAVGSSQSLLDGGDESAIAILDRLELLKTLAASDLVDVNLAYDQGGTEPLLIGALFALDEYDLMTGVAQAERSVTDGVGTRAVQLAWVAAQVAAAHRWGRGYRAACRLVSRLLASTRDVEAATLRLKASNASGPVLHALLTGAMAKDVVSGYRRDDLAVLRRSQADFLEPAAGSDDLAASLKTFGARPTLETAEAVWHASYEAADFERLLAHAPCGRHDDPLSRHASDPLHDRWHAAFEVSSLGVPTDNGPAVWYFITWHAEVERLFRLFGSLSRAANTYVISVGGSEPIERFPQVSALMLAGNVNLHYRPSVSWGGQKLLFQNVFDILECFSARTNDDAVFQIICNKTYPLTGPIEFATLMGQPGHRAIYAKRRYSVPPPAWHMEWPDAVVAELPTVYNQALDDVFRNAKLDRFSDLAKFPMIYDSSDFRLNMSAFNFSPRAETFEGQYKGGGQQYMIAGHSADMRWMSFGRLTHFIDLMNEAGSTYSRRMHPRVMQWAHSVLVKHKMRTGDPFLLMSRRFVDTILHNSNCNELFAASDLGFAPEMNFFDTIAYTPEYDMGNEILHHYFRTETNVGAEKDIPAATFAADVQKLLFMRKMEPDLSGPFIQNFAERCNEERGAATSFLATSAEDPSVRACVPPTLLDLLGSDLANLRIRLRDLRGTPHFLGYFGPDGRLVHADGTVADGTWSVTDSSLSITFPWGTKIYEQIATDGSVLILPPSEIVSVRNGWSLFMEIDLADLLARRASRLVLDNTLHPSAETSWVASRSWEIALLASLERRDPHGYPAAFSRPGVEVIDFRGDAGQGMALCAVDAYPVLSRLHSVSFADGRAVWVWGRASAECRESWPTADARRPEIALSAENLVGSCRIDTIRGVENVIFLEGGVLASESQSLIGHWFVESGAVWLLGLPGLMIARATQFQRVGDVWSASGWGWSALGKADSFRAVWGSGEIATRH